jgi:hypothetical protein
MGITSLPGLIQATGGTPVHGLIDKMAHIDLKSLFFNLVRSRTFDITRKSTAREVKRSYLVQEDSPPTEPLPEVTTKKRPAADPLSTSRLEKRVRIAAGSIFRDIDAFLAKGNVEDLHMGPDGRLSPEHSTPETFSVKLTKLVLLPWTTYP